MTDNKTCAVLAAALALPCCQLAAGKTHDRPNVLMIVVDDMGWGDLGCHGSAIKTPVLDGFFGDAIELGRYYVAPISSPTRAGLLTGRYPNRFCIRKTVLPPWRKTGLPASETTIADVLGQNGYSNRALVGKWHLGHGDPSYHPMNRGFTHFYGHLNGMLDYFTHKRDGELDWHNDYESCYDEGYTTDLIAGEAVRCIKEYSASDSPFFLYVAFNAPHSPYQAPEEEIFKYISSERFSTLDDKDRKGVTYMAMVSRLDRRIGDILAALESSGEYDDTLILFMSDNGGVPGMEPYSTNAPFRGCKSREWEGGVRASAAIKWNNGFMKGGVKSDQVMGFVDILPTLSDIIGDVGLKDRDYDGISMYPVLSGKVDGIDRVFYLGLGAAVSADRKLILAGKNDAMGLEEDYFTDILANPYEKDGCVCDDKDAETRLRETITRYDSVVPMIEELPYNYGKKGFKAPKEWNIFLNR